MTSVGERGRLTMLMSVGIVALVAAPSFLAPLQPYDAGISSSAATFTLHGLLPYRDYWFLYGPLSGIVISVPTALAGPSIELLRVTGTVLLAIQAGAALVIARRWVRPAPAVAIATASVVMYPSLLGLEPSAWFLALTLSLVAICIAVSAGRGGALVGLCAGLAFLARLDVGAYALAALLLLGGRRSTLTGFAIVAVPFAVLTLWTTDLASLIEQLIWYPIVGPRQFRGLPAPDVVIGQPAAALLSAPLVLLPRLAILLAAIRLAMRRTWGTPSPVAREVLMVIVFSLLCQLQTLGRADIEHFAQAATPSILLLGFLYQEVRAGLPRFSALAAVVAMCLVVGLLSAKHIGSDSLSSEDRAVIAASTWIRDATAEDAPIFVGLTSHRYTVNNPLLIYYLSGRRTGVRDAMFNPGVTNTDWGQQRLVGDLDRSATEYLVLDRANADLHEDYNDSRIPGSTRLDTYIANTYQTICDLGSLVIMRRSDTGLAPTPPCPTTAQ